MKDKIYNEFKIRVDRKVEVKRIRRGYYESKDVFFWISIKEPDGSEVDCGVQATGNYRRDLKKVFKKIQEALYL